MSTVTMTPTTASATTATVVSAVGAPITSPSMPQSTSAASSAATNSGARSRSKSQSPTKGADAVAKLLREVTGPGVSQARLREIWSETVSSRVRKAIAAHPGADPKTMSMAARLYLKEVLTNPSFEMLNLFSEEKFVQTLYSAYTEPESWGRDKLRKVQLSDRTLVARTLMLSPKLKSGPLLAEICRSLSLAEFKRELRDESVKTNLIAVVKSSKQLDLGTQVFLYRAGLISLEILESSLAAGTSRTYLTSGQFLRVLKEALESNLHLLAFLLIRSTSAYRLKDILKAAEKDESLRSEGSLEFFNDLYRDFLVHDVCAGRSSFVESYNRYGWGVNYGGIDKSGTHSREIAKVIWGLIRIRNPDNIKGVLTDMALIGFDSDPGLYQPGKIFKEKSAKLIQSLLGLDDSMLEQVLKSGLAPSKFFACTVPGSDESRLVERLDQINQTRFTSGKTLLYKDVELSWPFKVEIRTRRGSSTVKNAYVTYPPMFDDYRQKSKWNNGKRATVEEIFQGCVLPPGSRLIDQSKLREWGEKSILT